MNVKVDPQSPVIVGVGQVNASYPAGEPTTLMAEALSLAASQKVLDAIDELDIVAIGSRAYSNPGHLVAATLGLTVDRVGYTTHGGHSPQMLVNRAAWHVFTGKRDIVAIAGAESWRTRRLLKRAETASGWTVQSADQQPDELIGRELSMATDVEARVGFGDPLDAYPMLESAIRAEAGRTIDEQNDVIARLWSAFSDVAAENPYAAIRRRVTAQDILSPADGNRLISHPYRKLAVSNNDVDQAAAIIVTSYGRALSLGYSADDLVFVHGFGEAVDCDSFTARASYTSSRAIQAAAMDALAMSRVSMDDIALVDVYSCFPSAVQIGARALNLKLSGDLTVTGGLTFGGGPWNNYVTHAIATMVTALRDRPEDLGMCTANGGLLTKHAIGIYGARPPASPIIEPRVRQCDTQLPVTDVLHGPATILASTVRYARDDVAQHGFVVAETAEGVRILARTDEWNLLAELEANDVVGLTAIVRGTSLVDFAERSPSLAPATR
ncbi:hypothetical protein LG299_06905 [Microbacterium lacus]|uniref:hypothetical protein n=1 Tax=Microbacterium lacus TaxID=415217 RepID=UPI00384C7C1A